ncbi:hypothetical protein LEMA_P098360.1 [Plenodomus lingam JN3]|uniref:Methyltransferase domain-containing protein n=2 Tax=Leptosphaeria maculans TaxID=5022 RepID=E5A482_LEPMJ|nr:hypothetical protein LEMA_P098360.1 [Plenodomus lingam JN3]CBX98427.1 hypothetical protein LEMA_P098360.1 [Plenodomus lingam JN3]
MSRMSGGRIVAAIAVVIFLILLFHNEQPAALLPYLSNLPTPAKFTKSTPEQQAALRERMALSEKAWKKSVEQRDAMAKQDEQYPNIPFFPMDFIKAPYTIWDFFPSTWTCPLDIQRIGRLGDGGKWVCGMSVYESLPVPEKRPGLSPSQAPVYAPQDGLVVYSFGINAESSFEAELLERVPSARIWGYDFSVDAWGPQIKPEYRPRTYFKKVGLGKTDQHDSSPPFWTLPSLMKENAHSYIDILKIDIEGSEYDALDTMMDAFENTRSAAGNGIMPIGQVMIELHLGDGVHLEGTTEGGAAVDFHRFQTWWERLEKMGMRPVWMEINLFAVTLGTGKSDPRCTEYVWVNAKDERSVLWNA